MDIHKPLSRLEIYGHHEAEKALSDGRKRDFIISIRGVLEDRPKGVNNKSRRHLCLTFHDIETKPARGQKAEWTSLGLQPPKIEHVKRIIDFAEKVKQVENPSVLVHCWAGISRSTAASIILLRALRGPGSESDCVRTVFETRRQARPNILMLAHADELFGGKALWEAYKKTQEEWNEILLGEAAMREIEKTR